MKRILLIIVVLLLCATAAGAKIGPVEMLTMFYGGDGYVSTLEMVDTLELLDTLEMN